MNNAFVLSASDPGINNALVLSASDPGINNALVLSVAGASCTWEWIMPGDHADSWILLMRQLPHIDS